MKKYLVLILISLSFFACSEDDNENETKVPESKSEYYVKYHFICGDDIGRRYVKFTINYVNEKLEKASKIYGQNSSVWGGGKSSYEDEIICGPFKYGDNISLSTSNEQSVYSRLLEISVSKDNSPFALKVSKNSQEISYTINF